MSLQRIIYVNKAGESISLVAKIVCKRSKTIVIRLPDEDFNREIDRKSVDDITEAKIETVKE
jgi:hypothetical protein